MDIKILITQMTELFLVLFLGYFIFKVKLVDDNFVKKFTKLILNITMPAMVLASVLRLEERQAASDVATALIIAAALFFVILPIIGFLLAKLLRVKKAQTGLYMFMCSYSNVGFMGMPVISALFGSVGLFYTAIFNLIFNIAIFTIGTWMMNIGTENGTKFNVKSLATPGVILSAASLVIYFINVKFPVVVTDTIDMVGSITSPSAMLIIGCSLAKMNLKSVFSDVKLYIWTAVRQFVLPVLLWYPLSLIVKNELLLSISYILAAMPVANTAVLFATDFNSDTELAARGVFITTLFSLLTVPLCVLIH